MKELFPTNFFFQYSIPNLSDINNFINRYSDSDVDNEYFNWGINCKVDKIPLKWNDCVDLVQPSLDLLYRDIGSFNYTIYNPWINLYKRDYFQEVHDHVDSDLISVFFLNNEDDFSRFFFYDRGSSHLSKGLKNLLNCECVHYPEIKSGDVIFFPGHMLHGVTPHRSDIVRKTLAVNFDIVSG